MNELEKGIRKKGDDEIKLIEKNRNEMIERIKSEIDEEVNGKYRGIMEQGTEEANLVKRSILTKARMERKDRIEKEKVKVIDNVFNGAKESILNLKKDDMKKILAGLANEGKKGIPQPVVYVDKKYGDLIDAKTRDIGDFGVVVESKDGSIIVDNTLGHILKRIRPDIEPKIVKILFK